MARPQKFRHDREALRQPHIAMQLAGHVLGIEELRRQAKVIQDEIADAYDSVDGDGFEKAMVRKLVGLRAKDFTKRQDEEEGLAIYEEAVERGVSLAHTRRKLENGLPPHNRETGEITEESDDDAFAAVTAESQLADTMGVEPSPSEPQVSEHVGDERTEQPEDGLSASGDNSEITHSVAPSSSRVVADMAGEVSAPASPADFSATRHPFPTGDGGHLSEPSSDAGVGVRAASADIVAAKSGQAATISAEDSEPFIFGTVKKTAADYRPHCQNPETCAASGLHHCYQCRKAAAESEAA